MSGRRDELRHLLRILVSSARARSRRQQEEHAAVRKAAASWMFQPGVRGLAIGQKTTGGRHRRTLALLVYVETKLPSSKVGHPIPQWIRVPGVTTRLPTDVVEIGKVHLQRHELGARRSINPGAGVGRAGKLGGTLGCLVRRIDDPAGELHILSNYHVLAGADCAEGDPIFHPPNVGAGSNSSTVARLTAWQTPESSPTTYPNLIDAAIARVVDPASVGSYIPFVGVPKGISNDVYRDLIVQKMGFATGHRFARVTNADAYLTIDVVLPDGTTVQAGFANLVQCTSFTLDGDSGAVVLNLDCEIVGLHFAGSPQASFFCRIGNVTGQLGIEIVTEDL